jgi:hypothetical protein
LGQAEPFDLLKMTLFTHDQNHPVRSQASLPLPHHGMSLHVEYQAAGVTTMDKIPSEHDDVQVVAVLCFPYRSRARLEAISVLYLRGLPKPLWEPDQPSTQQAMIYIGVRNTGQG